MTVQRKPIPKAMRFEVFKRDRFTCQYCGAHPPSVLLHADHATPLAAGGDTTMDNLVTACEACNLGKGARLLSNVPQSMEERAEEVREREAQVLGYHAVLEAKRQRLDEQAVQAMRALLGRRKKVFPADQLRSVRLFIEKLGFFVVLDAAESAMGRAAGNPWLYFCGICWSRVREQEVKR